MYFISVAWPTRLDRNGQEEGQWWRSPPVTKWQVSRAEWRWQMQVVVAAKLGRDQERQNAQQPRRQPLRQDRETRTDSLSVFQMCFFNCCTIFQSLTVTALFQLQLYFRHSSQLGNVRSNSACSHVLLGSRKIGRFSLQLNLVARV